MESLHSIPTDGSVQLEQLTPPCKPLPSLRRALHPILPPQFFFSSIQLTRLLLGEVRMWELGQEAADHGQGFYLALDPPRA